ncbi:MAG: DUF1015 domain-containing protein [Saprospiraceae bacterium]|nr:DUF1015 domain-containing protein [Saprospiraceae bacterium]
MKILPFRAVYPNLEKTPHTNAFFDTVKLKYQDYVAENQFIRTTVEAIYIYRITYEQGARFTGIIAAVDIAEYIEGNIKKHEKTIVNNEDRQGDLLQIRQAAIKPVLLAHPSVFALNELIAHVLEQEQKFFVVEIEGEKHCFWQISDAKTIEQFQLIFAQKIPHAYIADGHHRSASFAALHQKLLAEGTSKLLCAFLIGRNSAF